MDAYTEEKQAILAIIQTHRRNLLTLALQAAQHGVYSRVPRKVAANIYAFRSNLTFDGLFAC